MIFHISANDFYVSCERLFRPDLAGKPLAVLSNGDGSIVALDAGAKAEGLRPGDAYFKVAELCERKGVAVFSSNHTLYADIGTRLVAIYNRLCPDVEVTALDECILSYPDWKCPDFSGVARHIRNTVYKETGISVTIGIAATRTLAKICNALARKREGILAHDDIDPDAELESIPVDSIRNSLWPKRTILERYGIRTANDLRKYPLELAKKNLTSSAFSVIQELNGKPATDRTENVHGQSVCLAKSFGQAVFSLAELEVALSESAREAAGRLQNRKKTIRYVSVYLMTNPWDEEGPHYCNQLSAELRKPTMSLPAISETALELLRTLFRPGYRYRKVMISLLDIEDVPQAALIAENAAEPAKPAVHAAHTTKKNTAVETEPVIVAQDADRCDGQRERMNGFGFPGKGYGQELFRIGTSLIAPRSWNVQKKLRSPSYTTDLAGIPVVY